MGVKADVLPTKMPTETPPNKWRKLGRTCYRTTQAVLGFAAVAFIVVYIVWRETERKRLMTLQQSLEQSIYRTNSFGFRVNMTTGIEGLKEIMSTEINQGAYMKSQDLRDYSLHIITSTSVVDRERYVKKTLVERMLSVHDDWVRYHSAVPRSLLGNNVLGKWKDTTDEVDQVLDEPREGQLRAAEDTASSVFASGDALKDPNLIFAPLSSHHVQWVFQPREKGSLKCYEVHLLPKILMARDVVTFEFIGPGVGLSSLSHNIIKDARVTTEYCLNKEGLIQTMVTEAHKDGEQGYHFRKEVGVFDYNKPFPFPSPHHEGCG